MALNIKFEINGKEDTVTLSDSDVVTASSIVERQNLSEIIVLKKDKSPAQFFTNAQNAENCMNKHNFPYMFTVKAESIKGALKTEKSSTNGKD